ncbi:MAG: twin-arginine translocase subunit TatC [Verrucomicrobia bacterium]|nr:twin-arginine translocase subunit TatC [Verrucomicrobiota bacterium]
MSNNPDDPRTDEELGDEGGPVKSFLDHLEDLRWVLIKSLAALGIGMLICLIAGDQVVHILKRPLLNAKVKFPGTNEVWTISWGTNVMKVLKLNDAQQEQYGGGTNRYKSWKIDLMPKAPMDFSSRPRSRPEHGPQHGGADEDRPDQPQPGGRLLGGAASIDVRRYPARVAVYFLLHCRLHLPGAADEGETLRLPRSRLRRLPLLAWRVLLLLHPHAHRAFRLGHVFELAGLRGEPVARGGLHQLRLQIHARHGHWLPDAGGAAHLGEDRRVELHDPFQDAPLHDRREPRARRAAHHARSHHAGHDGHPAPALYEISVWIAWYWERREKKQAKA